jgi:hypothetical protein
MADNPENNPDAEARKWFTIAVVGAFLYFSTVMAFVITRDADLGPSPEVQQHGQPH